MAAAHPPGDGRPLTLGAAIDLYWPEIAAAGYSRGGQIQHHAAVTKQLPWGIFRQMPCELWPAIVEAESADGLRPRSARERLEHYHRFRAFAWGGAVRYLTFGAAADAFLAQAEHCTRGSTLLNLRGDLRALGRALARRQRLRDIPVHWWQEACEALSAEHRRCVLRFLRWLRDRHAVTVTVVPPPPVPFWRQDIAERIRLAPDHLSAETGWQPALGAYLRHQRDALGVQEASLHSSWRELRRFGHWLDACGLTLGGIDEAVGLRYLAAENRRGLGNTSLRLIAATLRMLTAFLTDQGVFPKDPLAALRVKLESWPAPTTAPTEDQMQALIAGARSRLEEALAQPSATRGPQQHLVLLYRDVALLEVLCGTGLRSTEVCRLRVSDLDTDRGRLRVRGKGSYRHSMRERVLDLPAPGLRAALADYLNARQPDLAEPLFASARGGELQHAAVDQLVARYRERAGVGRLNPRDLRHGFASALVARGADPLTVQTLMGHESLKTTLRHYVALNEAELREVWLRTNPLSRLPAHREGGEGHRDPQAD